MESLHSSGLKVPTVVKEKKIEGLSESSSAFGLGVSTQPRPTRTAMKRKQSIEQSEEGSVEKKYSKVEKTQAPAVRKTIESVTGFSEEGLKKEFKKLWEMLDFHDPSSILAVFSTLMAVNSTVIFKNNKALYEEYSTLINRCIKWQVDRLIMFRLLNGVFNIDENVMSFLTLCHDSNIQHTIAPENRDRLNTLGYLLSYPAINLPTCTSEFLNQSEKRWWIHCNPANYSPEIPGHIVNSIVISQISYHLDLIFNKISPSQKKEATEKDYQLVAKILIPMCENAHLWIPDSYGSRTIRNRLKDARRRIYDKLFLPVKRDVDKTLWRYEQRSKFSGGFDEDFQKLQKRIFAFKDILPCFTEADTDMYHNVACDCINKDLRSIIETRKSRIRSKDLATLKRFAEAVDVTAQPKTHCLMREAISNVFSTALELEKIRTPNAGELWYLIQYIEDLPKHDKEPRASQRDKRRSERETHFSERQLNKDRTKLKAILRPLFESGVPHADHISQPGQPGFTTQPLALTAMQPSIIPLYLPYYSLCNSDQLEAQSIQQNIEILLKNSEADLSFLDDCGVTQLHCIVYALQRHDPDGETQGKNIKGLFSKIAARLAEGVNYEGTEVNTLNLANLILHVLYHKPGYKGQLLEMIDTALSEQIRNGNLQQVANIYYMKYALTTLGVYLTRQ